MMNRASQTWPEGYAVNINDNQENVMTDEIRPYGPGKFRTILDSYVYDLSLDCLDDEAGGVDDYGHWYGLVRFDSYTLDSYVADGELNSAERGMLVESVGAILCEDSQGFVYVDYFATTAELERKWSAIVADYEEDEDVIDEEGE